MQSSILPKSDPLANVFPERVVSSAHEYAEVAVPLRVMHTFTYRLPHSIRSTARVGSRVVIPFGSQQVTGYIVGLHSGIDPKDNLVEADIKEAKELLDPEPLLTPEILEITRWVAEYYAAPWGEVLKAALPAGINATVDKIIRITLEGRSALANELNGKVTAKIRVLRLVAEHGELSMQLVARQVGAKDASRVVRELERQGWVTLAHEPRSVIARAKQRKAVRLISPQERPNAESARAITDAQQRILDTLGHNDSPMSLAELLRISSSNVSSVRVLEKRGMLKVFEQDVRRDPLLGALLPEVDEFELSPEQSTSMTEIEAAVEAGKYAAFLLHGVTGSGKTEIYIRAMRAALSRGKSAMMLVPEIALTPVFSRRLRTCFGDEVAIFHSSLTTGERYDEWRRLKRGEARLVIGTRSAVYAPVKNLGVVVIDEEHETSYRQQESPYYHGRDTAIVRARMESAVVILGSATPSLESFHNAKMEKYRYLSLPARIGNRAMATAEIIDMRAVFAEHGRTEVFSDKLLSAIEETSARGEQSIILLNRRGFSSFVLCRSCGESIHCPNCDVTLTFHQREASLVCHYCNHRRQAPKQCPLCNGKHIYYVGEGTEQIEASLRRKFPSLRIARLDRDTTSRRKLFERTLMEFSSGDLDMLVGTQMLAKGHDFPNVTLVGVVSVDAGLSLPDFRSAERTFQLITQVAGRAGRGRRAGRVLIQTYHPDHYALRHACAQDYAGFYEEELRYRKSLTYPPFVALSSLLVHGKEIKHVQTTAADIRKALDEANKERECRVLGPAPAPLARLKGEHRQQILIKSRSRVRMREVIDQALTIASNRGCDLHAVNVEIDPVNLM